MGGFGNIARGLGQAGSDIGSGALINADQTRQNADLALRQKTVQMQWQELQERLKKAGQPQIHGTFSLPDGSVFAVMTGPDGTPSTQQVYKGTQKYPEFNSLQQMEAWAVEHDDQPLLKQAQSAIKSTQVQPKPSDFDEWRDQFKRRTGRDPNDREIELWHRQPRADSGLGGGSTLDQVAQDVADRKRLLPSGKLGIQVENRMRQLGLKLPPQLSAAVADKLEQRVGALDDSISILKDIQQDSDLLEKLPKASLVQLAQSSERVPQILSRFAGLFQSDADKLRIARLAGNLRSFEERINVIRGPLGASGFKGPEGWAALQAQAVQALSTPGVNLQVLKNTMQLLTRLRDKTNEALSGEAAAPDDDIQQILDKLNGGGGGRPK